MTKDNFFGVNRKALFKGLATALLMPGGFILAALAAIVFAAVLAVLVYFAAFWAVCQELAKAWRQSSFREAAHTSGRDIGRSRPPENVASLPEDAVLSHELKVWAEREAAHRKWLQ